ncbi:LapA family protein [Thiomonas sp. FB-6]|uniref:LapA family protein n=1 Tax=Thiomonas sp. FB-6 TaxID=1158291 RepID=UPI00036CE5BC|nr:LapA family protein [Thiomonas sp. FB-6]
MRAFNWFVRLILFLLLFGLALNNLEPTVLHLLFGTQWRAPLFVLLLAAFALGVLLGIAVMLPGWLRARRLQRHLAASSPLPQAEPARPAQAAAPSPLAAGVIDGTPDGV